MKHTFGHPYTVCRVYNEIDCQQDGNPDRDKAISEGESHIINMLMGMYNVEEMMPATMEMIIHISTLREALLLPSMSPE